MATNKIAVLVVGSTGNLGKLIVEHLATKPNVSVRTFVRKETVSKSASLISSWKSKGVSVVEGDLNDANAVKSALEGIHTVISALQGGPDVILDTQFALVKAAAAQGAKRFVPSDFGANIFTTPPGAIFGFDLRRKFHEEFNKQPHTIKLLSILHGGFFETVSSPFFGQLDIKNSKAYIWGDGNTKGDYISYDDAAKFTAEAVSNPEFTGVTQIQAEVLSWNEVISTYEKVSGQKFERINKGSVESLKKAVDEVAKTGNLYSPLPSGELLMVAQYLWVMASGVARLNEPVNKKLWPHVKTQTLEDFFKQMTPK